MYKVIKQQDWDQWKANQVTRQYLQYLQSCLDEALQKLVNQDPGLSKDSLEQYAIKCVTLRSFIDGLGQSIDLESIAEDLVQEEDENAN